MMFSNASVFSVPNERRIEMIPCLVDSTLNSDLNNFGLVSNDTVFECIKGIATHGP